MEPKTYGTAGEALVGFLQRLFVAVTVGSLVAFVLLRSEVAKVAPLNSARLTTGTSDPQLKVNDLTAAEPSELGRTHKGELIR